MKYPRDFDGNRADRYVFTPEQVQAMNDMLKEAREKVAFVKAHTKAVEKVNAELTDECAELRVERDEARTAFVECFDLLTGMRSAVVRRRYVYLRETYRTLDDGHAALYAACTKGGEGDASD